MNIKQMKAQIIAVEDLSPTAREITLALPEPLGFLPGAFVNVFMEKEGKRVRRAYSISSDYDNQKEITLSIRRTDTPTSVSPVFWQDAVTELPVSIMGPLGLNTADKIEHSRIFLFAFGIGVSVVKGLIHYVLAQPHIHEVVVVTGSRTDDEVLYKGFFEKIAQEDARVSVRFVLSQPGNLLYPYKGYVQEYVADYDFNDATVYICGQGSACRALQETILAKEPKQVQFLIETFDE